MKNIVIADDHDLVRDTIAAYLGTVSDFKVFTAADLMQAFKLMNRVNAIDLLILDYSMPGMNGLEGLDRACASYPTSKVALMSGVANRDVANSAMAKGASGFIPKSLTATSFINAIKLILSGNVSYLLILSHQPQQEKILVIFAISPRVRCKRWNSYALGCQTKRSLATSKSKKLL